MTFNTFQFVLLFLPLAVASCHVAATFGSKCRRAALLVFSLAFYAFWGWKFLALLAGSVVVNHLLARAALSRGGWGRRILSALAVAVNVGWLFLTKYYGFFVTNINAALGLDLRLLEIVVPIGISFFTFSQIAFLIGTWRGEIGRMGLLDYALYVCYFPKLLMGPITEPSVFFDELGRRPHADWQGAASGIRQFAIGLVKKAVFADTFAAAANWGFSNVSALTGADALLVMLSYTFQIYFDFSGYSDMAIGVSRLLGVELPINFDSPYKAASIREFWKGWHVTLTKFLTKYVYIPLGGSRCGEVRTYVNILVVFLVSGLWHGANWTFVLWGSLHGILMVRDRLMARLDEKVPRPVRWLFAFVVLNVLWTLFRADSVSQFCAFMRRLGALDWSVSEALLKSVGCVEFSILVSSWFKCGWQMEVCCLPYALYAYLAVAVLLCGFAWNSNRIAGRLTGWTAIGTVVLLVWGVVSLGRESVFLYFNF